MSFASRRLPLALTTLVVALLGLVPAAALAKRNPRAKGFANPLYADGQAGRFQMTGQWLYRPDPFDQGVTLKFPSVTDTTDWAPVTVPNAWNATDVSPLSMDGTIGWYRRDFRLPDTTKGLSWLVRFESVNYKARVWLNGHALGAHTGAFLPWELKLKGLLRAGVNHLVVRVDSRHGDGDLPPDLDAGWWNYGGLLREVYLRRIDTVDIPEVDVRPKLPCPTCAARESITATVTSYSPRAQLIDMTGKFGNTKIDLGSKTVPAGGTQTFTRTITVRKPRLWSPKSPNLYRVHLEAGPATYDLHTGIRSVTVRKGRLYLNGQPLNFRGVGLHEDSPSYGAAIHLTQRKQILAWIRDLGATFVRAHYPLSPEFEEIADHHGIMLWSEVPVYHLPETQIAKKPVQDAGLSMLSANIKANGDHPSIITWSVGNELDSTVGPGQAIYIQRAADLVRSLDTTRPVAYAFAGHPATGCQSAAYKPIDLLGFNDYFGWYTAEGTIADRDTLSSYLDTLRACYPRQALAVTEFGAEADRDGPVEEKGTYAFQNDFIRFHLNIYASKPWLSGVDYWAVQEFKVSPNWSGGNPRPHPPLHEKGLVTFGGVEKPAYAVVRSAYRKTKQYGNWRPAKGLR